MTAAFRQLEVNRQGPVLIGRVVPEQCKGLRVTAGLYHDLGVLAAESLVITRILAVVSRQQVRQVGVVNVAPVEFFRTAGKEASVAQAILQWGGNQQYAWLANFVSVAILPFLSM